MTNGPSSALDGPFERVLTQENQNWLEARL